MTAHVLAGPRVDALRVALRYGGVIDPYAVELLQDAKRRALWLRSKEKTQSQDVAVCFPNPTEA